MSHLAPYPLGALATRMLREFDARQEIFDLPLRKFVLGDARHAYRLKCPGADRGAAFHRGNAG